MALLNKHQPVRPRHHPEKDVTLRYRTFPSMENKRPIKITDPRSMIAQSRLYRFVRSGQMQNGSAIADIHDYLFHDVPLVSKKIMGMTVVQTTMYNPRSLRGISKIVEKNTVVYMFNTMLDFQYGLEWQICTWLRNFLNDTAAPGGTPISGPDVITEELDMLASATDENYKEVYEDLFWDFKMKEPDWVTLVSGRMEEIPVGRDRAVTRPRPTAPVSLVKDAPD